LGPHSVTAPALLQDCGALVEQADWVGLVAQPVKAPSLELAVKLLLAVKRPLADLVELSRSRPPDSPQAKAASVRWAAAGAMLAWWLEKEERGPQVQQHRRPLQR
jgi:hypothetical protein